MSESTLPPENHASGGDYVVVARRYRPQSFDELIGQQHVSRALSGAIASDRVGHAYLFTGARGVGKTSAARILAKALNCVEGPTATPCGDCEICQGVASGDDVDVLEIDGASNRGIDEIRQLRQNVAVRPSRARFKIYIIDEVHMLTKEAFNALLKTLEEPPEHVKFIFATTEPNKIPITILSRCQRYDFAGIDAGEIRARLEQIAEAEGVEVEAEALQIIATRAAGSMRDSQSLLEQLLATGAARIAADDVTEMLGLAPAAQLSRLVRPLVSRQAAEALAQLDEALAGGAEVGQLIDQLLGYFRDAMTQRVGCDESLMLHALPAQRDEVRQVGEQLGVQTLLAISQILDQTAARLRLSTQGRTLAEMAIVRICHLEDLDELASLIAQLKSGPGPVPAGRSPERGPKSTNAPRSSADARQPGRRRATRADARVGNSLPDASQSDDVRAGVVVDDASPATSLAATATKATAPQVRVDPGLQPPLERSDSSPAASQQSHAAAAGASRTDGSPVEADAAALWQGALQEVTGLLADSAAEADRFSMDAQGRLVASFPASRAFCRDACLRPANLAKLEAALVQQSGRTIRLALETHGDPEAAGRQEQPVKSRRQQQAEISSQPYVKKAMELFQVDPSRLRYTPPE
ncbi:MAG: DNA polymerase III subunit gamma/tau [Planctomycetota bacterium]